MGTAPRELNFTRCPHRRELRTWARYTFDDFDSASQSCRLCRLYRDMALAYIRGHLPGLPGPCCQNEAEERATLEELKLTFTSDDELRVDTPKYSQCLVFFRDDNKKVNHDVVVEKYRLEKRHRLGRYTNSSESLEQARKWLSDCLTTHTCPEPNILEVSLPKRLLEVGGSSESPIKVVESRGQEYPYVCLSHRWGDPGHRQLKTTTRTIKNHMGKIEWHDLPATFQDAVTVCRAMNIKYLWIDSLCILQSFDGMTTDELEATCRDFAQENSTMARTYQNSHFTISADTSTHMDSGMFSKDPVDDYEMQVVADDGRCASIFIRGGQFNHDRKAIPDLETRGWTLQEYLLPPRVLHFGEFDLEWRCSTRITCGCGALDREETQRTNWHRHHHIEKATKPPPGEHEGAIDWWEQVVSSYTRRQLTNPADKLPALSGMAQLRKQVRGGVYLAGLWKDSLIHDLCWCHEFENEFYEEGGWGKRPSEYRAPSWSWASLDSDTKCCWWWAGDYARHPIYPGGEPEEVCKILEVACKPSTSDQTGPVGSGFLDIQAGIIPAEICQHRRKDYLSNAKAKSMWSMHRLEALLSLTFFKPDCRLEDDTLAFGDRIYCAPIAQVVFPTGMQYGCLVLKKLDAGTYKRVGFCVLQAGTLPSKSRRGEYEENLVSYNLEKYILPENLAVRIRII